VNAWIILEYCAWGAAAALGAWMLADALAIGNQFSEDVLLSSEEGHDELIREERPAGGDARS
jgi:hypothetical protein